MMMRVLLLALLVSQVCCDMNLNDYWMSWKSEFNKNYRSVREEAYRRVIWEKNVLKVMKHNEEAAAGQHTFTTGLNHLSDMTTEEVNAKLNGLRMEDFSPEDENENFTFVSDFSLPPTVNWTEDGFVTPVKDQGDTCNACWAFSVVGALEAQMKNKKGRLVPLSVQNLVDCSNVTGNHGCLGGFLTNAFNYIINEGISKDDDYPYEKQAGECHAYRKKYGRCSGFRVLQRHNEFQLEKVVANIGPVAVGIHVSNSTFHHYKQGIYNDSLCPTHPLNHAVLVVGYGKEEGQQYWLVKNSWGVDWGEGGYIRMQRNKNQCGIGSFSVVPIV